MAIWLVDVAARVAVATRTLGRPPDETHLDRNQQTVVEGLRANNTGRLHSKNLYYYRTFLTSHCKFIQRFNINCTFKQCYLI